MTAPIQFGTDGVRGRFGAWPITPAGAHQIGCGVGNWSRQARVVVGRDTRSSGSDLLDGLVSGIVASGAEVVDLGIVPTAAVSAAVAADTDATAGIMITASHNPSHDNGLKVLDGGGAKVTDLEPLLGAIQRYVQTGGGRHTIHPSPLTPWLRRLPEVDLVGRTILFDAAHGAAFSAGLAVLEERGATVHCIGSAPDGTNINAGVGAMFPPTNLQGCDLAICLDGDADRLVLVDPNHGVLDGDDLLWMLSQQTDGPIVGTIMSNGGLEAALGDRFIRTGVGDAKVHAEMVRVGAALGGEPSGHVIIKEGMPTSCGIDTALRVLAVAGPDALPAGGWTRLPQAKRNVKNRIVDHTLPILNEARDRGLRVVLRASGTEPLVRVMVEGTGAESMADRIVNALPVSRPSG